MHPKRQEIIEKFTPEFIEKYVNKSPMLNHVLHYLQSDIDPYIVIEKLIEQHEKDIEIMQQYYLNHAHPQQPIQTHPLKHK